MASPCLGIQVESGGEEGALVGVDAVAVAFDVGCWRARVAAFGDDVDERMDDGFGCPVLVVFEGGDVVVPVSDAGVGLPGVGEDAPGPCRCARCRR